MFGSTMLLTVGQALEHARDGGTPVRLCIGGEWISGRVLHSDGQGLALAAENGDTCVIRLDAVSCVRLPADDSAHRVPSQSRNALGEADHQPAASRE